MYVVGLTGPIGSGKSTLAKILQEKGAVVIDADRIGHDLLQDSRIKSQLEQFFGKDIFTDAHIDRQKLAKEAFASKESLDKLNRIMWPPIVAIIESEVKILSKKLPANSIVIVEAPLLLEAGLDKYIKMLIAVVSSADKQLERLKTKGYSEEETKRRMAMQTPKKELVEKSDYLIKNENGIELLQEEAEKVWHFIKRQSV